MAVDEDKGCAGCAKQAFIIARNPTPGSRLPFLLRLPVAGEPPLVLATADTWPVGRDLFCYRLEQWPERPEIVEEVPVQACWRAGKAVHLVLSRRQRHRSMFIWTQSRGRTLIFWRTQKTMQAARPGIRVPAARGLERRRLLIAVDSRERYAWKFPREHAQTERRDLPAGDYGIFFGGRLVAAVERKSVADLVNAISAGKLRMQLAELSTLPRGALVVEGRLSDLMKAEKDAGVKAGWLLNLVAALQAEYPNVQWSFAETRAIAQDVAYRWLSAAATILQGEYGRFAARPADGDAVAESPAAWGAEQRQPPHQASARVSHGVSQGASHEDWAEPVQVRDRVGRQREALDLARRGQPWTVRSYREYFHISEATAYQDLKTLVARGDLVLAGPGRPLRYVIPE